MKKVQVLGPFNSGTNLLINILIGNCTTLQKPGEKVEVSENMISWKHTLRWYHVKATLENNPDTLVIIIYKNLYNWMMSMGICSHDILIPKGMAGKCSLLNLEFDNIVECHNVYHRMYKNLHEKFPKQVVVINYYKLIQKDNIINYLRSKLEKIGLDIISDDHVLNKISGSARGHSVSSSDEAFDKYSIVQEAMKKTIASNADLKKSLDIGLMDYFEKL